MLVIMLLITPRTFLHQGAVVLGRRGFTNGPSGSDAGIGIGGRPWLQKVAALTVAISLTIATADTFKVAEQQYNIGVMDAAELQKRVENGTELKVIRVISDTFLWLAQAQTLIRLFPRQREKIIIKWTAFALIILDVLFSILNTFVYDGNTRPRSFVDAVPALAYLFQLALSLLYCAWVIYYSITKKRFAFYHPQMRNICLVALLSLLSVLVPVVFFVLDISKPTLASWGDYVRWVGAAAASVVVWEWVERIEALERNDKKDGVLGREVFDGDEMLDMTPSSDFAYIQREKKRKDDSKSGGGKTTSSNRIAWPAVTGLANRYRSHAARDVETGHSKQNATPKTAGKNTSKHLPSIWPTRPAPAATPVSRTDTASAESTVYAVRYHPISEATPPFQDTPRPQGLSRSNSLEITQATDTHQYETNTSHKMKVVEQMTVGEDETQAEKHNNQWEIMRVNPFRRKTQQPPPEVSAHRAKPIQTVNSHESSRRWDLRGRMEDFAAAQAEKLREKTRPTPNVEALPVTVIPAPTRRRNLTTALEELEAAEMDQNARTGSGSDNALLSTHRSQRSVDNQSPRVIQISRMSDPYTPSDLNRQSVTQRGAISFVTTAPHDRDDEQGSFLEERREGSSGSSRSSPFLPRSSSSVTRDGLPILRISAPPRRPPPRED